MRIGELAERVGVTTRALRYYEQQFLLSPPRDENGYRIYDELEAVRARNIKDLLDTGLTTDDVFHYRENGCLDRPLDTLPRCTAELDTVRHRLAGMDERITRLQQLRSRLARHNADVEASVASAEEGTPASDQTSEAPSSDPCSAASEHDVSPHPTTLDHLGA